MNFVTHLHLSALLDAVWTDNAITQELHKRHGRAIQRRCESL